MKYTGRCHDDFNIPGLAAPDDVRACVWPPVVDPVPRGDVDPRAAERAAGADAAVRARRTCAPPPAFLATEPPGTPRSCFWASRKIHY
jgi:hypothetical protein